MVAATKPIDEAVRKVLSDHLEWEGEAARLTCGNLERKLYLKVHDVLASFGGKWSKKAKAHLFAANCQDELDAAIDTGVYIRAADLRQIFGEFETPDDLADVAVERLGYRGNGDAWILEPSAGSGQLIRALNRRLTKSSFAVAAVEIQSKRQPTLIDIADSVTVGDFLAIEKAVCGLATFHYVLMNPPFAKQADIDHVLHAWKFLADGGRLVAIMSPGWTFRENRKSREFREFVQSHDGEWEANPEGSFSVSGTNVNSLMLVMDK